MARLRPTPSFLFLAALLSLLTPACSDSAGTPTDAAPVSAPSAGQAGSSPEIAPAVGRGFVVWESSRGGRWRIWRRNLDGSEPRAITPDEPGRAHCCAHIAPDGRRMVYLSMPQGQTGYPRSGAAGEMRLLDLGTGEARVLVPKARTYFEHRAAVWHDDETLVFIDDAGRTVRIDVDEGTTDVLLDEPRPAHGWLVNRTLSFATEGAPTFSFFDPPSGDSTGHVREQSNLGGCQPYFAHHRAFGVWVAGAGGPIRAIDLASRRQWPLVAKSDSRLPEDRRYLYFPMPSRDGRLLAWAASSGSDAHDHETSDYDVFVAETDPQTLELLGTPWRTTYHRGTDRFPDVWAEPLELGRHAGEVPYEVALSVPGSAVGTAWTWNLGDGRDATGRSLTASWDRPGRYAVVAHGPSGETLYGAVHASSAAPPAVVDATIHRGDDSAPHEIRVRFDEPIFVESASAELQRVGELSPVGLRDGGRVWVLRLDEPLDRPDRLILRNVADRAQRPNVLQETTVVVTPPRWPSHRDGLVFLWQSDQHANRVVDPASGREEATVLESLGRAWTDRHGAAVLRGGSFQAKGGAMERLFQGVRATNELSLEMTFTADRAETTRPSALFGFGTGGSRRNLTVAQEGDRLTLRLNTPSTGHGGDRPVVDLGPVRAGKPQHLVISYTPGTLRAYLDGRQTAQTGDLRAGFYHWQPRHLRLGAEGPGPDGTGGWTWMGRVEGVAVWNRALPEDEAKENHRRYAEILREREMATSPRVLAELVSRSRTPSLNEIAPYREALAVFEYRVRRVLAGPVDADVLRVVHRVLLDGREMPMASLRKGHEVELELEPFDAQTQLDDLFLSDDFPADPSATLWWSDRIEP